MKIELRIDNIIITEEIDAKSEIEIRKTVDKIFNGIMAANKVINSSESGFNLITEVNNVLGFQNQNKIYETDPALITDKPASEKQIKLLKKLGYSGNLNGLSCRQVADIIEQLNKKNGYDYQAYKNQKAGVIHEY